MIVFGIILFIFIVGAIASFRSIQRIFFSGMRWTGYLVVVAFLFLAGIGGIVEWLLKEKPAPTFTKKAVPPKVSKKEAEQVRKELLTLVETFYHNSFCFRANYYPEQLCKEIYQKYLEDFEWKDITPLELVVLVDNGFAEIKAGEAVIFNTNRIGKELFPKKPGKRNDSVRKNTTPLSQYYNSYQAALSFSQNFANEAREFLNFRKKLSPEEFQKFEALLEKYNNFDKLGYYS